MKFYYPLKPFRITLDSSMLSRLNQHKNYIAQVKKNGWRIQIQKDGNAVRFLSRHNKDLEPIVQDADWALLRSLVQSFNCDKCILDGELMHRRGSQKNTIYLWDAFEIDGQLKLPYKDRYAKLIKLAPANKNILITENFTGNFVDLWNSLGDYEEDEGIVLKDLTEPLFICHKKPSAAKSGKQFKVVKEDPRNYT